MTISPGLELGSEELLDPGAELRRVATFFVRQPEMTHPRPQAADADFDRMIVSEPGSQFDERDIGFLRDLSAQRLVVSRKLRFRPAARLVGRHIAGSRAAGRAPCKCTKR